MDQTTTACIDEAATQGILALFAGLMDLPDDPLVHKRHVVQSLARLVNAAAYGWVAVAIEPGQHPAVIHVIDGGWLTEDGRTTAMRTWGDPKHGNPCLPAMMPLIGQHATRRRRDIVPDEGWYPTPFYDNTRRPLQLDDTIYSIHPVSRNIMSAVFLTRHVDAPPFSEQDRTIAHIVTGSVDGLHAAGVPIECGPQVVRLTRRLRQVLLLTLAGYRRRQIAQRLELSEYTIADHLRALYRHFSVRNRHALTALFANGGGAGSIPNHDVRIDAPRSPRP